MIRVDYSVTDYGAPIHEDVKLGDRFRFIADAIVAGQELELIDASNYSRDNVEVLTGVKSIEVRLFNPRWEKIEETP